MTSVFSLDTRDIISANGAVAKMTCTTGSETITAPTDATAGLPLACAASVCVEVEDANGATLSPGWLRAFIYHTYLAKFVRAPSFDCAVVGGGSSEILPAIVGLPRYGQLVMLPDGLDANGSCAPIITLLGTLPRGIGL